MIVLFVPVVICNWCNGFVNLDDADDTDDADDFDEDVDVGVDDSIDFGEDEIDTNTDFFVIPKC